LQRSRENLTEIADVEKVVPHKRSEKKPQIDYPEKGN
jgi:hypothetical protein